MLWYWIPIQQPEDINIGEIGSFTKPLRISYFKGLRRLRDEDFRPMQRIEVKSGQMFQAFQRGLGLKNEVRPRQKSPSNQKDRANFVNVKIKVFKWSYQVEWFHCMGMVHQYSHVQIHPNTFMRVINYYSCFVFQVWICQGRAEKSDNLWKEQHQQTAESALTNLRETKVKRRNRQKTHLRRIHLRECVT